MISWIIFTAIVVIAYLISVLVDVLVMKKHGKIYTEKMNEYISKNDVTIKIID